MEYATLPDRLLPPGNHRQPVYFIPYASRVPMIRGKSCLRKHLISLITEGGKVIHVAGRPIHLAPGHILLLAAGNYLYTERFSPQEQIKSTMIFFDDDLLQRATDQVRQAGTHHEDEGQAAKQPFALFAKDDYLQHYIRSVQSLLQGGVFTIPMQLAKLNELLVFLYTRYPEALSRFQHSARQRPEEERMRQVMEENVSQDLSIGELAFLCHMSLPTFKRKFQLLYSQSPARWLQERRLTLAADLLRRSGARPGEVYLQAGYENHSSFSKAFKRRFGILPKDY